MTGAAACADFFNSKLAQAEKVFDERYASTVGAARPPAMVWANRFHPELYRRYHEAVRSADALWAKGEFGDAFKKEVLELFRTMLEICRLYAESLNKEAA